VAVFGFQVIANFGVGTVWCSSNRLIRFLWIIPMQKDPQEHLGLEFIIICQSTTTKRQRSDLFGFRVKLPPVTTSLTTQR